MFFSVSDPVFVDHFSDVFENIVPHVVIIAILSFIINFNYKKFISL